MTSAVSECRGMPCIIGTVNENADNFVKDIFQAVRKGDKKKIKKCLEKGNAIECKNSAGQTPLMAACLHNKVQAVEILLQSGANPNERATGGYTAVHIACYMGNVGMLVKLLEAGGDLRLHDDSYRTPKEWAERQEFYKKRGEMLEFLDKTRYFAMSYCGKDNLNARASLTHRPHVTNSLVKILRSHLSKAHLGLHESHSSLGFGKVYCDSDMLPGMVSLTPLVAEASLSHDKHGPTFNNGVYFVMESMRWDKTAITVKRLHRSGIPGGDVDLLIHECEHISKLRHPSIMLLMGVCQTNNLDSMILIYERVEFGSLFYILHMKRHILLKDHVKTMATQIVDGLIFIQQQNLAHCALTSHAVTIVTDHQVKIINLEYMTQLGMDKKCIASHNKHKNAMYNWLAPEILQGDSPQVQTDVFSLCVLLWEMLQAEIPWGDFQPDDIKSRVLSGITVLQMDVHPFPEEYTPYLQKGLQRDYKDRNLTLDQLRKLIRHPDKARSAVDVENDGKMDRSENNSTKDLWLPSLESIDCKPTSANDNDVTDLHSIPNARDGNLYSTPITQKPPDRIAQRYCNVHGLDNPDSLLINNHGDQSLYGANDNLTRPAFGSDVVDDSNVYPETDRENLFESGFLSDKEESSIVVEKPVIAKTTQNLVSHIHSSRPRLNQQAHNVFSVLSNLRTHTSRVRFNESGNEIRHMTQESGDSPDKSNSFEKEKSVQKFSYLRLKNGESAASCKPASHCVSQKPEKVMTPNGTIYDLYNRCGGANVSQMLSDSFSPDPGIPSSGFDSDTVNAGKVGVKEIVQKLEDSFGERAKKPPEVIEEGIPLIIANSIRTNDIEIPSSNADKNNVSPHTVPSNEDIFSSGSSSSRHDPSPKRSTGDGENSDHVRITKWVDDLANRISRNMVKQEICTEVYAASVTSSSLESLSQPLEVSAVSSKSSQHSIPNQQPFKKPLVKASSSDGDNRHGDTHAPLTVTASCHDMYNYNNDKARSNSKRLELSRSMERHDQPIALHASQAHTCLPTYYADKVHKSTPYPKCAWKWDEYLVSHTAKDTKQGAREKQHGKNVRENIMRGEFTRPRQVNQSTFEQNVGERRSKRQLDLIDSALQADVGDAPLYPHGRDETVYIETVASNPAQHTILRTTTDLATGDVTTHSLTKVFSEEVTASLKVD